MNKIGFMQGRLVNQIKNKIQYFPDKNWQEEIEIAIKENFNLMEWTINYENIKKNPLYNGDIKSINKILRLKKFKINSVTCDFFMQKPFFKKKNLKKLNKLINDLLRVIRNSNKINIKFLVLPLVDGSSISNDFEETKLIEIIKKKIIPKLDKVKILFETDYKPNKILPFIKKFNSKKVGINYDTGNSASLNYKIKDEIRYFKYVKNIHIKDRLKFGHTVRLGNGDWDYKNFFITLKKVRYNGYLILQTARSKKNDHIKELHLNRKFVLENI